MNLITHSRHQDRIRFLALKLIITSKISTSVQRIKITLSHVALKTIFMITRNNRVRPSVPTMMTHFSKTSKSQRTLVVVVQIIKESLRVVAAVEVAVVVRMLMNNLEVL